MFGEIHKVASIPACVFSKTDTVTRKSAWYRARTVVTVRAPRETKSARRYPFSPPNSRFQYVFEAVGNKE